MPEHPNASLIRRGYEAFNAGDAMTLTQVLSEDVVHHEHGALGGEYKGLDATLEFYGRLATETSGTFRCELQRLMAHHNRVVAIHRATAKRHGRTLDAAAALVFDIGGSQATAIDVCQEDPAAWDKFWS